MSESICDWVALMWFLGNQILLRGGQQKWDRFGITNLHIHWSYYWTLSLESFLFLTTCHSVFCCKYLIICNFKEQMCPNNYFKWSSAQYTQSHCSRKQPLGLLFCLLAYVCIILEMNLQVRAIRHRLMSHVLSLEPVHFPFDYPACPLEAKQHISLRLGEMETKRFYKLRWLFTK